MNIEEINLSSLPWTFLKDRRQLPNCAGVYVVTSGEQVLYVGCSENLLLRWISHHRYQEIKTYKNPRIYWFAVDDFDSLLTIERSMINKFQPVLNGKSKIELANIDAQQVVSRIMPNAVKANSTISLLQEEGRMRLSVDLPVSIHKRLEAIAMKTGWKKSQLCRMAVENFLDRVN